MSDMNNGTSRDFSYYDLMETEALEEILRLDAEAPDDAESDLELILYVMEVLADRRKRSRNFTGKTAEEAYESFIQHYLPEVEELEEKNEQKRILSLWLKRTAAAAAMVAIVFCGSLTAKAFGCDIWKIVATWAQETFSLGTEGRSDIDDPATDHELPYASLQEALFSLELVSDLVPTWIPNGYALTDIEIFENPLQNRYVAIYVNGTSQLKITVYSYLDTNPELMEQSEGFVEIYTEEDTDYYIFSNHDLAKAAWIKGSYECCISGNLTIEELKVMINSIAKG